MDLRPCFVNVEDSEGDYSHVLGVDRDLEVKNLL